MDDLPPDSLDTPAAILPPDDFGFVFSVKKNYVPPPFPPSNEIAWVNKPGTHGFYPVADEDAWKRVCTKLDLRDSRVRLQRSKRCDQLAVAFKEEQARMRRESVKAAVYGLGAPPPVALKSPFQIISQQNWFSQASGNSRVPDAAHSQQFNFAPMLAYPAKRNFATPAPSIPAPPAAKRPRAMKMYRTEEGVWLKDCVVKAHDCLRDFPPEFAERLRSGRGSLRYHPYRRVTPDGGFVGDVYVDYTGRAHNDLNFSWMGRSVALEDRDAVEESKVSSTWLVPVIQMTPSDIPAVIAPALPSMLQAGVGGPVAVPAWQTNGAGVTMSLRPTNPLPMSMSMSLPMPMQPQLQPRLIISGGPRPRAQGIRVRQMAPYNESNVMVLPPVSNRPLFDHGYSGRPRNPGPPRAARAPMRPMRPSLAMTQRPATTTKWFADPLAPSAVPPPLRNPSAVTRPRPPLTAALVAALRPNGHHASNGHHIPPPAAQGSSGPSSSSSMEATQRGKISIIPINRMLDGAAVLPPPPSVPRPAKVVMQALDGDAAFQADDTEDDPLNAAGSKAAAVVDPLNSVSVAPPEVICVD